MLFLKTIVISSLIGVIGGSSTGIVYKYFNSVQANQILRVETSQPILLSSKEACCLSNGEKVPTVGATIVFAETPVSAEKVAEINPQPVVSPTPTPEPVIETPAPVEPVEIATDSAVITPDPTPTPDPVVAPDENTLNADLIFDRVNQIRANSSLPPFQKDPRACELAVSRTPELYSEIVVKGNMHAGLFNRNLPYWVTENIINIKTEEQAINWWMHSRIHHSQILGNFQYSCVACLGNSCTQIFTNFTPKTNL